ncbi:hypothetical protein ACWXWB_00010 [Pantoea dispersa]|uniref:hypothetical protein n=1 Tax=Pantoea dispersa TaxID=59814 RepID=UPI002DB5B4EC|nr:hypothetical protein [Pantoea dispersa]MEB5974302.1 cytochrome P450 [Pantoea dispersa]
MNPADITILDLSSSLSEEETVSLVEKIHQEMPGIAMVALGETHQHQRLSKNLRPAFKGYFCKSLHPEKISMGLRHVWH